MHYYFQAVYGGRGGDGTVGGDCVVWAKVSERGRGRGGGGEERAGHGGWTGPSLGPI